MKQSSKILITAVALLGTASAAQAALIVNSSIGGVPSPALVTLDNLDWLALGTAGGVSATGLQVSITSNAAAVQGSLANTYAAPWIAQPTGIPFGNNQADGENVTTYLTAGSTGAVGGAQIELILPGNMVYFGLLWGSVDDYNTLEFFDGATSVGSITGADVIASPVGDQGVNGTVYVNITSTDSFNRIVATSSQFAFEFDNLAWAERIPVSEPGLLALLGLGLVGVGVSRLRRRS